MFIECLVIFWWCLYGFLCRLSSLLQTINFSSFIQSGLHLYLFIFFSLIAVAETSKTIFNSSGECGYFWLFPGCRGNAFYFPPLRTMFAVSWSYTAFVMFKCVSFVPAFWKVYIINTCWSLSKIPSAFVEKIMWFIFLQWVNMVYLIDWFVNVEESLHYWDKIHLVKMYDLFTVLLHLVC